MSDNTNRNRTRNLSRRHFLGGVAASAALPFAASSASARTEVPEADVDRGAVATGEDGMVVSVSPAASEVGARVLGEDGNAVDAAVAVQFALNVTQPHSSGIGGGGFMLYYDAAEDSVEIVNSRERAPAGATPDMFLDGGEPIPFDERHTHGNAVGVPGTASGLQRATARYGSVPIEELIDPAIDLAADGIEVDAVLAEEIEANEWKFNDAAREVFVPDGEPLSEGDTLEQPDLARTLELMRDRGIRELYEGEIADAIAATVQEEGGSMTTADLCRYEATIDEPVRGCYRGADVYSMPPPSSGGLTVIQILNLLEPFELGENYDVRSGTKYHLLAEAMRLAYADRGEYMGDPEFVDVPSEGLLDPAYVAKRRELLDPESLNEDPQSGDPWAYQPGDAPSATRQTDRALGQTTHFTVADSEGNLVSYTTTIEQLFGTGFMVPGYGFMLNNELTDFDAEPGGANQVQPNKRPLSSMSPTIMARDSEPFLTVGSPGGPTIITSVVQAILHHLEYGLDLADAIDEPSIYAPESSEIALWEEGIPAEAREVAAELGNEWSDEPGTIGNVNMLRANDAYEGAADQARDGLAIGLGEE